MARLSAMNLEAIREQIKSTGELRLHIQWSRSGLTTKCRLWHPDGHIVGSASGGGYDKEGAAVGEAIVLLFGPELARFKSDGNGKVFGRYPKYTGQRPTKQMLPGVRRTTEGKTYIDGACGIECMLDVLRALGFDDVSKFSTGKDSNMIIARRTSK